MKADKQPTIWPFLLLAILGIARMCLDIASYKDMERVVAKATATKNVATVKR